MTTEIKKEGDVLKINLGNDKSTEMNFVLSQTGAEILNLRNKMIEDGKLLPFTFEKGGNIGLTITPYSKRLKR